MKKSSKRPYREGCIFPRGRILWIKWREVRRHPDGTTNYIQHAESTKSDDMRVAQSRLRAKLMALGHRPALSVDAAKVSYEDMRENFLAYCVENKRRSLRHDREGKPTLATLPRLDKAFAGWLAKDITTKALRRFRSEGHAEGLSDMRLNRYIATIRAMMRQAAKDELITSAEMPAYFPTVGESKKARGAFYITQKWADALMKILEEPLRSAFWLAYKYAVRVNELRQLRWRDIDLKARTVIIRAEVAKTGEPRTVPLPKLFNRKPGAPDDLVFPIGDRREQWQQACVKVGAGRLEELPNGSKRYVGPLLRHTRHTAVRNMIDKGLDRQRAKDISGHVTDTMFNRYDIGKSGDVEKARKIIED